MLRRTALLLSLALVPQSLYAQAEVIAPRTFGHFNLSLLAARPVGEFADQVDKAFGFGFGGVFRPAGSLLGLRAGGGLVVYGHESRRVCLSTTVGCRIQVDLQTNNTIFFFGVGPELSVPLGPVRPYVDATAGLSYFATISHIDELRGVDDGLLSTTNFDDATFAWTTGGGVRVPLWFGKGKVGLDLGVRYHGNGRAEYLREGDIQDQAGGGIVLHSNRGETNLVTLQLGVAIEIRSKSRG